MPAIPVIFYALAAMLFWGMSFVWTSFLLTYYQPVTIIFIRLMISSVFLIGLLMISGAIQKINRQDYLLFFFSALFNPFFYFLGENYGVKYSTSTIAAIVIATIPLFTPIAGYFIFHEKLKFSTFAGIGISFFGIGIMLISKGFQFEISLLGGVCLAGAIFAAIFYSVLLKKLSKTYSVLLIVAVQNIIGILLFMPLFFLFEYRETMAVPLTSRIIWSFILLAILASSVSFVFFAYTVKKLGISKANIFSNLIPVFTAFFSFLLLDEAFGFRKVLGMIIVIAGVTLSEWRRSKRATE